jgi:hypothetical protein
MVVVGRVGWADPCREEEEEEEEEAPSKVLSEVHRPTLAHRPT